MKHPLALLLAHYLKVYCLPHNLMAFWTAKHTSLMLNQKKKQVRGFVFVFFPYSICSELEFSSKINGCQ